MSPAVTAEQNTKSKKDKKNMNKRKKQEEESSASFLVAKDGMRKETNKKKKARFQTENDEAATAEVGLDQSMSSVTQKKDKKHSKKKNEGEEETGKKQSKNILITDARFAPAQLDPRFQRMPKREAKVPIDSRFARMLSDRSFTSSAAPVDKRGKPRKVKEVNPLLHYYLHEKEPEEDAEVEREQAEEENGDTASDGGTDASSSTTDDENDDDEDDDLSVNSDICRYLMANHEDTPTVDHETHRLAIVNMDWDHIKSVDLYVVMSSCLPKSGQILSVTIYPSEFGLKCMEIEAVRGPTSLICDDEEEQSDEEPDPEVVNERLRVYEMNKLRYYYAVVVFDSSATANHVYNTLDGTELTRTSNIFDLRFIPDSMEFKHPPRDATTEAPTSYKEPDFQTRALQHCKVNLTWEDDEPQRVKTLRRKFNVEKLDDLNEYLASTDDSDDEHGDVEKLRALLDSDNSSDTDQSKNDRDMEITFNTGLEDLSKRILEKKDKKTETAWDRVLRRQSEKRKARQNRSKYSSDDDSSDYDAEAPEQADDFFVEESSDADIKAGGKKSKRSEDRMKNRDGGEYPREIEKEREASKAELELLFAEEQDVDKAPKGYNMKSKNIRGKKKKEIAAEEKLPNVDFSNDPRFAALYTNHLYALDPTDPHYKRSVAFARKQVQKQTGSEEKDAHEEIFEEEADLVKKPAAIVENGKHELSSIIRSLKRNIGNMKK